MKRKGCWGEEKPKKVKEKRIPFQKAHRDGQAKKTTSAAEFGCGSSRSAGVGIVHRGRFGTCPPG
jgi:hypothetical protein